MNGDYKESKQVIEVPLDSGVEGFLVALRAILRLPRVVDMHIDIRGKVTVTRFVRDDDPRKNIEVDFDTVLPSAIVRNNELSELVLPAEENAAICIAAMFQEAQAEHMYPIAFVTGANTALFEWHRKTTGIRLAGGGAYGLPVHRDRFVPDEALILATAFAPGAALIDTRKSYKITMPGRQAVLQTRPALDTHVSPDGVPSELLDEHLVAAGVPADDEVDVLPKGEKKETE